MNTLNPEDLKKFLESIVNDALYNANPEAFALSAMKRIQEQARYILEHLKYE